MRYTESKMSKIGEEMLYDIQKNTVDFGPNYDDSMKEPLILPAAFPFLLTNGTTGIAVGMATNMAPHNLGEVVAATEALINNPELTNIDLMEYVKGPDFPSGGLICGRKGIMDAYTTGRGKVVCRAKYEIEENDKGNDRIVFYEIPYQVNKADLVKKIDDLRKEVITGISSIKDHSDRDGIRIVVELKKDAVANIVLNMLFTKTALQSNFNIYNLALKNGKPTVLTLKDIITSHIEHREEVIERRTRYDLAKAEERAHILAGLKIGLDNIDRVIEIIKQSENNAIASLELQKAFGLDEIQANAIIDMKLGRLSHLETNKILEELKELEAKVEYFKFILSSKQNILKVVKDEIVRVGNDYADRRKTEISQYELEDVTDQDFIKEEQVAVLISNKGFAKRLSIDEYKTQNRGTKGSKGIKLVDGDFTEHIFIASSHDIVMFITDYGKAYYIKVWEIPEGAKVTKGINLKNLLQIENQEKVTSVICFDDFSEDKFLLMVTKNGITKKVCLNAFRNAKKRGVIALILEDEDSLSQSVFVSNDDDVMYISKLGKGLRVNANSIRVLGRNTRGVKAMKLAIEDEIIGLVKVEDDKRVLMVTETGKGKQVRFSDFMCHGRATQGQKIYSLEEKTGTLVNALAVDDTNDILFITQKGQTIRIAAQNISIQGRTAMGIRVVSFKGNDTLVGMAITDHQEFEEDEIVEVNPEETPAVTTEEASVAVEEVVSEETNNDSEE